MQNHDAILDDCLFMLGQAKVTRIEKLKLEVQIRRAKHLFFSSREPNDRYKTLLLSVCSDMISLCNSLLL